MYMSGQHASTLTLPVYAANTVAVLVKMFAASTPFRLARALDFAAASAAELGLAYTTCTWWLQTPALRNQDWA